MKIKFYFLLVFIFTLFFFNCEQDKTQSTVVQARDRVEQQLDDIDSLQVYLNTHYFNSDAILNQSDYPSISDIEITELIEGETLPINSMMLIDAVQEQHTVHEDIDYTYYTLTIEEGLGEQPHFTDQVRVNYEGFLTNNSTFDESVTSIDVDLAFSISGWNRVLSQFRTASHYTTNPDGTVSFENYGIGIMFLPSGLAYFNSAAPGIPSYSCLIFKFELHQYKVMDHDNDFIPSYMEDSDGNMDVFNDNTDGDQFSNFSDTDDDGDGYSTFREVYSLDISDLSLDGLQAQAQTFEPLDSDQFFTPVQVGDDGVFSIKLITLEDTNDNGIPNYLDAEDIGTLDN